MFSQSFCISKIKIPTVKIFYTYFGYGKRNNQKLFYYFIVVVLYKYLSTKNKYYIKIPRLENFLFLFPFIICGYKF